MLPHSLQRIALCSAVAISLQKLGPASQQKTGGVGVNTMNRLKPPNNIK